MFAFVLPHKLTAFLMFNPLACLILYFAYARKHVYSKKITTGVIITLIIALVCGFMVSADIKSTVAAITIILYMFCFPFVTDEHIDNKILYFCLFLIIISQIVYILNVGFLVNFFDTYYPISEDDNSGSWMRNHITIETIVNYRLGGLYHNSNQCSKYLTALIALFLCNNTNRKVSKNIPFVTMAYISVLLTGSRTGFVISSLLIGGYMVKNDYLKGGKKAMAYLGIAIAVIYFLSVGVESSLRGLEVSSGFENSANLKFDTWWYYVTHENNMLLLLFGHIDSALYTPPTELMAAFDSEYGSYMFNFGIVGFVVLLSFYYAVYKRTSKQYYFMFFYLLWMVSSTILCAYRTSFVFMILLSFVYTKSLKEKELNLN